MTQFSILKSGSSDEQISSEQTPVPSQPTLSYPPQFNGNVASGKLTESLVEKRWDTLRLEDSRQALYDDWTKTSMFEYAQNIEHFVGTVKLPVGIAGPLSIHGLHANGDFRIPLATTEAALVASYHRGSQLITSAGGATAMLVSEGVSRTPGFAFHSLSEAGQFVAWITTQYDRCKSIAQSTTRFGQLHDINVQIEGNHVYLVFDYVTGDASGQNMVTIATNAIMQFILEHSPIEPRHAFLDANLSGDKKPNAHTLRSVRGKKVSAEVHISPRLVKKYLHTDVEKMIQFGQMTTTGGLLSGSIGINAHYANALAALYIACGQDPACVAESAVGMTRFEQADNGDLCASVTLPNIMVGTVGGGTQLPTQKACLDILGLNGTGHARALAEVVASVCLAGELSIAGAFCAGHFARAHKKLARGK
ncbi:MULTISPECIES: hydroxymethylglutaryl-CoA reductase [Vibrio]|uniref:hydroxymethylglutaryl-CoA reductase (NADPH) n=2 Tax=Vibrio TaxID=662 RepID=A0A7X4LM72_9VIBR|nr:hydroxymethylglutaryl-CoA reductase [Vibrio nitrifigilis]MZI94558.1 3-hydroxy-3-methylglutaryl-CoA reductase [Vibrio eleionomae]